MRDVVIVIGKSTRDFDVARYAAGSIAESEIGVVGHAALLFGGGKQLELFKQATPARVLVAQCR